ncbi:serine phosphatase RsbU [Desulfocucumis palustris]|uniref:Serine phosphatase RsbU n=2 Tax=Desulfocucumis palustris TaxID=1898651 RepID=A0A2L2XFP7_9FIRM|nr:serine phosphatase RsbU [Desulfocucumis palustris]
MKVILFASAIIILSIILVGSFVYFFTEKEVVRKLKSKDLVYIAESIASKIDGRVERAKETSLLLARDPEIIQWVTGGDRADSPAGKHAIERITELSRKYDYNNSFVVSTVTNHYWAESGRIIDTMTPADPDDSWFFEVISSKRPVSVVIDYNAERKGTFVFVDALMGNIEHPLGVAGVGLSLDSLSKEFQRFKYGEDSDLWVIDGQGKIYLSDNVEQNGKNIRDFVPDSVKNQLLNNFNKNNNSAFDLDYKNSKGQLIDLISYPVKSAGWVLVLQIPRNDTVSFLETIKLNTLSATLIALISITFFFYFVSRYLANPYKRTLQMNQELESKVAERTRELHEKNQKLIDSIEYAVRIQEAVLPSKDKLSGLFKEHFILWKPKDLVGGDFYWVKRFKKDCLVVVGDCTGHGVPGALMTMLSISILNQIVDGHNKENPALLLKKLNNIIKQTLGQQNRQALTDDGLDIGICYFNGKNTITFAGAKCSLYTRKNDELKIVKGNRKSIGYVKTDANYAYTNNLIDIEENDVLYMTTDGYIDQGGGSNTYSFGKKRFIEVINGCYQKPLALQFDIFIDKLNKYMGDEIQRDDITVMAFKFL